MNKREFVLAGAGALAGGAGWAAGLAPAPLAVSHSRAAWQARVGETFEVFGAVPASRLVLQRVQARGAAGRTESFTLLFAAQGAAPATGTLALRPARGGALALYVDAAGQDADGTPVWRSDCCHLV